MKRNGSFRDGISRFMAGRNGGDQLTRFISITGCVAIVLALVLRNAAGGYISVVLTWLTLVLLVISYWRIFSRNVEKRRAENARFMQLSSHVTEWFFLQKDRFSQRKEYVFFRCPGCHCAVRVPRGKGKLRITCRRCGYAFEKKT